MDSKQYQGMALRTMADQGKIRERVYNLGTQATQLDNASRGLAGDTGEVLTCIQRHLEYGKPLDIHNLREEVGDVLWRLVQLCSAVGLTLEECMDANIAKLKVRYPDAYSDFLADEDNRDREAERLALVCKTTDMDMRTLESRLNDRAIPTNDDVIEALDTGWRNSGGYLTLPGDKSNVWPARWVNLKVRGETVSVPSYLRRRLDEIKAERAALVIEPVVGFGDGLRKRAKAEDDGVNYADHRWMCPVCRAPVSDEGVKRMRESDDLIKCPNCREPLNDKELLNAAH